MRLIFKAMFSRRMKYLMALVVLDSIIFGGSNAKMVASFMLAIGFILLLATVYQVFHGILSLGRLYGLRLKRQNRFALYITGVTGIVIALQSIGELTLRDVVVLLPLAGIAYLYSSYGSKLYNINHGSE